MIRSLLVIVFVFATAPLAAQEQIIDDWREQRSKIKSIRLKATGTRTHLEGGTDRIHHAPIVLELAVDLERNWVRRRTVDDIFYENFGWATTEATYLFDGAVFARVYVVPDSKKRHILLLPNNSYSIIFTQDNLPFLSTLGVLRNVGKTKDGQRTIDLSFENSMTRLKGAMLKSDNVLRTLPDGRVHWEFVVDPERNHAITKFTQFRDNNQPTMNSEMQLQQIDDLWVSKSWNIVWLTGDGVTKREELQVKEIQINPKLKIEDFQIEPGPDDLFRDDTKDEG